MSQVITIALAGNPNSGKTTLFNALTGARQHVGNYPGVTVEKKQGTCVFAGRRINVVDLPGTYSLTAYSTEEMIARDFIFNERPDVVVDVIDASNLERNLYLATQLMEMDVPVVLAFNMSDVAKNHGLVFDIPMLSELLGVSIVETVGHKTKGRDELLAAVLACFDLQQKPRVIVRYSREIEDEIEQLEKLCMAEPELISKYGRRWLAVKLIECDSQVIGMVKNPSLLDFADAAAARLKSFYRDDPEIVIADRRYGFISGACQEAVKTTVQARHDTSDSVDAVLIHRLFGLPIFLALMYIVFQVTFSLGRYPVRWLEILFGVLGDTIVRLWPGGAESPLRSLLVDGVLGGVGGVVVFLPNILLLFLAIAFLEDSGYMARAAFLMDRIMHRMGLHGKSFIPMLIGFGCSVPAIMATRILENRRNRFTTIMVIPLMSCGARLPIYALIISAFIANRLQGPVLWLMYLIGILLAVVSAKILRATVFKGQTVPFVMELPPYRMPTAKSLLIHTWQRGWLYLKKAGTVILGASILLWAATSYPLPAKDSLAGLTGAQARKVSLEQSLAGSIGKAMSPVIKPLGFDWRIGTALLGATMAKEMFVSQMSIIYALDDATENFDELRTGLVRDYTPLQGFCIMLFCLISTPCVATLAATKKETGQWRWAAFQFFGLTALGYVVTFLVYQIGSIFV